MIEETYSTSIDATIEEARRITDEAQPEDAAGSAGEKEGLSGLFSKVTEGISKAAANAADKFRHVLNNMIEALAIMLVTSCLIPILVIVFFLWLVRLIVGINIQLPGLGTAAKAAARRHPEKDE